MSRTFNRPAAVVREAIRIIEEFPPTTNTPGLVRVTVGPVNEEGVPLLGEFSTHVIEGKLYEELVGDTPPEWAPDKPKGTYRNDDLWFCVDAVCAAVPAPKPKTQE